MNDLASYQPLLNALTPWSGMVPPGYVADFMGILTDIRFQPLTGIKPSELKGGHVQTKLPRLAENSDDEWWFETVACLAAAREARDRFVMVTLGAQFGGQAVRAHRALRLLNPMPCVLVAVEPVPENFDWMLQHFRDNGIDPDAHWLLPVAVGDTSDPVFFPIGGAGTGVNNCVSTNEIAAREEYARELIASGNAEAALRDLLTRNTTGLKRDLLPGHDYKAEIKLVSCITLKELLGPFARVDYIEADIQQSEILVFPPFIDLLRKKVRRIHIGTHGTEVHAELHELFYRNGWEIVFSFAPNGSYLTDLGVVKLNDGVLTLVNPDM